LTASQSGIQSPRTQFAQSCKHFVRAVAAWHSSAIQISAGGEMFNTSLKSQLDAVCTELAAYVAQTASTDQGRSRDDPDVSYRAARQGSDWWPVNLGAPSAVGAQNALQYAVFPGTRRLAIKDGERIEIYDTGKHRIFGVAQAQSVVQTLTFTSQDGLVRITDLRKV
jgi:hypothetical protein